MSTYPPNGSNYRRSRGGRLGSILVALGLGGGVLAACGGSGTSSPSSTTVPSAAQAQGLLKGQDPATLAGGNAIVGTSNGQRLVGGPGANTIVALGPNETIVGGGGPDQLGAYGANATIVGGHGPAYIYGGGPHATLVSGSAPDLLVDTTDNGTVRLNGNGNEVLLSGHNDHVACMPTSHNDVIYGNTTDSVNSVCQANGVHLASLNKGPTTIQGGRIAAGPTTASPVHGSGTHDDPFIGPCDDPSQVDCTVSSFAPRKLNGWAQDGPKSEPMQAYKCPADHPYLLNQLYQPPGSSWLPGVSFNRDPSWVNIWAERPGLQIGSGTTLRAVGTDGPSNIGGSVTNWNSIAKTWQAVLHCTSDFDHGWGY